MSSVLACKAPAHSPKTRMLCTLRRDNQGTGKDASAQEEARTQTQFQVRAHANANDRVGTHAPRNTRVYE
eukprot:1319999-Pleurochrysis_carterae.AAC.1